MSCLLGMPGEDGGPSPGNPAVRSVPRGDSVRCRRCIARPSPLRSISRPGEGGRAAQARTGRPCLLLTPLWGHHAGIAHRLQTVPSSAWIRRDFPTEKGGAPPKNPSLGYLCLPFQTSFSSRQNASSAVMKANYPSVATYFEQAISKAYILYLILLV